MLRIDPQNAVPLWRQIQEGILGLIASGSLRAGDPVDSVREAARVLGVNPLTVSKAYRGLADQGVLEVRRGEGTFVAAEPPSLGVDGRAHELRAAARTFVGRALSLGADRTEAAAALRAAWPGADNGAEPKEPIP